MHRHDFEVAIEALREHTRGLPQRRYELPSRLTEPAESTRPARFRENDRTAFRKRILGRRERRLVARRERRAIVRRADPHVQLEAKPARELLRGWATSCSLARSRAPCAASSSSKATPCSPTRAHTILVIFRAKSAEAR